MIHRRPLTDTSGFFSAGIQKVFFATLSLCSETVQESLLGVTVTFAPDPDSLPSSFNLLYLANVAFKLNLSLNQKPLFAAVASPPV